MIPKKKLLGVVGVLGVCLSAGIALPLVNAGPLKDFSPGQLMIFRGFVTALVALLWLLWLRRGIGKVDRLTVLIALVLPVATLGLLQGVRYWGPGPTIIIITATPVVNFIAGFFLGRKLSWAAVVGFVVVIGGVTIATQPDHFNLVGFLWSVLGTIANGVLYELFAQESTEEGIAGSVQKCFFGCLGMGILGALLCYKDPWPDLTNNSVQIHLTIFVFFGGLMYWFANLLAFTQLPTAEASVLAQIETPAVVAMSGWILGEETTRTQWVGVVISLIGASLLMIWLAKQGKKEENPCQ